MAVKVVQSFRELDVYQAAFQFQQDVFQRSKKWPKEDVARQREDGKFSKFAP